MKKEDQEITLLDSDISSSEDYIKDSYKTTNINILLNRVRLDKKKEIKKKVVLLSLVFLFISSASILFLFL